MVRPVVYSKMSLVEPVREAISSTQQQNTAAPLQMIIGCLVPDLCTVYTHRHQPDLPTLGRFHGKEEETRRGKAGIVNKFSLHQNGKLPSKM